MSLTDYRVRSATASDWEQVKVCIIESGSAGMTHLPDEKRKFDIALVSDFGICYVVEQPSESIERNNFVGYLAAHFRHRAIMIVGMVIRKKFRNLGFGKILIDYLVKEFRGAANYEILRISSPTGTRSNTTMLLSYGFEISGVISSHLAWGEDEIQFFYPLKQDHRLKAVEDHSRLICD